MLEIRRAERAELARIAEIHVDSWRAAYRGLIPDARLDSLSVETCLVAWEKWFSQPEAELWVARREGRIEGFGRLQPATDDDLPTHYGELTHLYLDPAAYGTGIGAPLFERVLESAIAHPYLGVALWVLEENARARSFYEGMGLVADGGRQSKSDRVGEGVYEVRYRVHF